ncbi:MAG: alpha/beta fold hydrolase [Sarcina sp.]
MENLLIIAGWNSSIDYFESLKNYFKDKYHLHYIDFNEENNSYLYKIKIDKLIKNLDGEYFHVIAWSMGSLVLLENYKFLEDRIKSIALLAGTAKFTKDNSQYFGWDQRILKMMIRKFEVNPKVVIEDFNKKSLGDKSSFKEVENEKINKEALIYGLKYLKDSDFREVLKEIKVKTLIIQGDNDFIVEKEQANYLKENIIDSKLVFIKEGNHRMFLEINSEVFNILEGFWR